MNKLDLSRCLMFRTDPRFQTEPPDTAQRKFLVVKF